MQNDDVKWKAVGVDSLGDRLRINLPELLMVMYANYCSCNPATRVVGLGARDINAMIGTEDGIWQALYTTWNGPNGPVQGIEITLDGNDGVRRSWRVSAEALANAVLEVPVDAAL